MLEALIVLDIQSLTDSVHNLRCHLVTTGRIENRVLLGKLPPALRIMSTVTAHTIHHDMYTDPVILSEMFGKQ